MKNIKVITLSFFFLLLLASCQSQERQLIGTWEKPFEISLYPKELEFFEDGTYAGVPGTLWHGGDYVVLEDNRLRLTTLMGGQSVYAFTVEDNRLLITAENNQVIKYTRKD